MSRLKNLEQYCLKVRRFTLKIEGTPLPALTIKLELELFDTKSDLIFKTDTFQTLPPETEQDNQKQNYGKSDTYGYRDPERA